MPANVHAIALIANRPGKAADISALLEDNRLYVCTRKQFVSRCQTGRACTNDDCCLLTFHCFQIRSSASFQFFAPWDCSLTITGRRSGR